jgi:HSP20 family protein
MMRRISEDMDQLFESFGFGRSGFPTAFGPADLAGLEGTASLWTPHIEVYEREGKLVINADLPGVKKEDVHAEITPDAVTIRGQRKQEKTSSEGGLYRSERSYGAFYRTVPLPEGVDAESASASFRDGVLQIEMDAPQRPARGRTLQIGDSGSNATPMRATSGNESQQAGSGSQQQR